MSLRVIAASILFIGLGLCSGAAAQTAHFSGAQTSVSGFNGASGVAVDASGNVFVAEGNVVYETVAVGGVVSSASTVKPVGHGFTLVRGVAVDGSGNVFVADWGPPTEVYEIVAVGGVVSSDSIVKAVGHGFLEPSGVAVDGSGNVFVADYWGSRGVSEVVAVGGVVSSGSTVKAVGSNFSQAAGVAVDASGNVFVADGDAVYEIVAVDGVVSSSSTVNPVGSGFNCPNGVAVDASGNVFVADSCNNAVKEILAAGGYTTVNMLGSGFSHPSGVAVDGRGNFFVADSGNNAVKGIQLNGVNFGSVNVATPGSPIHLNFTFDTGGSIVLPAVMTQGATGLDFTDAGTGSCTTNGPSQTYNANDTCTVDVIFTPKYPGLRYGAVQLLDNSGRAIATAYVYGTGVGPQTTFAVTTSGKYVASALNSLGSGFGYTRSVAVDGSGNVYVADGIRNDVYEIVAVGGSIPSSPTIRALGSGVNSPEGVAVDGAGNVYVADGSTYAVHEIVAVGGSIPSSPTIRKLGSGFNSPAGVAVDGAGNVYVADFYNDAVKEMMAVGGSIPATPTIRTLGSGFHSPAGVAVDGAGNVYVADFYNNAVKEIMAVGGSIPASDPTIKTLGSGFTLPAGVAVDAAGNVYVAGYGTSIVSEMMAVGGSIPATPTIKTLGSGFNEPYGVAVDGAGNVFVADLLNLAVKEMKFAVSPALIFATAPVGSTSSDSPQTVTVENVGNATLTFAAVNYPADFSEAVGVGSDCTSSTALTAGESCTLSVKFAPLTWGGQSESLTLTDNAPHSPQYISLSGATTTPTITLSPSSETLTAGTVGVAYSQSFTAGGGTSPYTYAIAINSGTVPSGFSMNSSTGVLSLSGTPSASGSLNFSIVATDSSTSPGPYSSSSQSYSLTVNRPPLSVLPGTLPDGAIGIPYSQTITASGGSGNFSYAVTSGSLPAWMSLNSSTGMLSGTPTGAGALSFTITATDTGTSATIGRSFTPTIYAAAATASVQNFGDAIMGSTSSTATLTFTFDLTATVGSINALTQGAANLDFTDADTGSCTTNGSSHTYYGADTCTVDVIFTPRYPGPRYGAVQLLDNSGRAIATAYIYGTGVGPQVNFLPGTQSTFANASAPYNLEGPIGVAVDAIGSLYIVDFNKGALYKETLSGGSYTQSTIDDRLSSPGSGVALDGSGNVYIADPGHYRVLKETFAGGVYTPSTIVSSLDTMDGVAVDGDGSVYILLSCDHTGAGNTGAVYKLTPSAGGYIQTTIISGLNYPAGIATDGSGNLYIAGNGQLLKETLTGALYIPSTIGDGMQNPVGVALDGGGNVYITDSADVNKVRVLKETLSGGSYTQSILPTSNLGYGYGLAVDGSGNLFIADGNKHQVLKEDYSHAPSLSFATATDGGTTDFPDGALSVNIANNGNAPLMAISPGLSVAANFMQVSGTGTPVDCTSSFSLAPGTSCNLSVEFAPVASANGTVSGSVLLTDNNLNASPSTTQTIPLTGTAQRPPTTISISNIPFNAVYGESFALYITYNGDGVPSVVSNSITNCTVSGEVVNFVGAGTCSLTASATLGTHSAAITGGVQDFTITAAPLTIAADDLTKVYGAALPTLTASYMGIVTADAVKLLTTPPSITTTATASSVAGSYVITASGAVDQNYSITYVAGSITITAAPLTIIADSQSKVYGATLPTLTASYSGFVNGDSVASLTNPPTLSTTATATSQVAGSPFVITASGAVDPNYSITYVAGSMTTSAATASVTPTAASKSYGASDPVFTGTLTGFLPGDSLTAIYSRAPGETVLGNPYAISASLNPAGVLANYTITYNTAAFTINKAIASVELGSLAQTYNGSPLAATAITNPTGLTVTFTYNGSSNAPTAAGNYTVVAAISDANYSGTAAGTLAISKAAATVELGSLAQTYTGTPLAATASTNPAGLTVTLTYNGSSIALTAGSYAVVATISDSNYSGIASGTLIINQTTQAITFEQPASPVTYGVSPILLSATGGASGNPVTFGIVSGPGSITGQTLTITGAGTVLVAANQAGDTNYSPAAQVTRSVFVTAVNLNFSAGEMNFGSQPLGSASNAQTLLITNPNGSAVAITGIQASGDFSAASNCPIIAGLGACSVNITFTPTTTGARIGTLMVTNAQSNSTQTVQLTGTGTAPGIQFTPSLLNFGGQVVTTTSGAQPITILNTGTASLNLSNIVTTGDFATTSNCATVPAGSYCSLTVTFAPLATGARAGTIAFTDNAGNGDQSQIVNLSGMGTVAGATLTPSALTFPGTVVGAASFGLTTTLTNTGTAALTGISVAAIGDFTQTNTCQATLAPEATCTISVRYSPTVAGSESGTLTVTDSLGTQSASLLGTGLAPGASLSTAQLVFGGQLVNTSSLAQTVVFTNTGTAAVNVSSVVPTNNFTDTTNCSGSIAAGASCSINIIFTPTTAGSQSGTVTVTDSVGTQVFTAQGQGVSPGLAVTPSFEIFGAQVVGTTSQAQTLIATNTGTVPLTLNPITASSNFSESDQCPVVLQPGASCAISLSFSPAATGVISGSLIVSDASGLVSTLVTTSGQGTLPGITASPSMLFFGSLPVGTTSQAQTVTVSNTGTAPLQIGAVSGTGDFAETDTCASTTLAAGSYCVINVTMTPSTIGTRTGAIHINDNADGAHMIALSGMGQETGVNVSPTSLAFGSQPFVSVAQASLTAGTALSVTITNTGTLPLQLGGFSTQGDFTETDSCGATVAAGRSCTLTVNFVPTALGHRTGTLMITDNAGGGTQMVSLEGDGSPVGLTLSPPVLNYGVQTVGIASQPQTALLTNNTGQSVANLAIVASGEYSETDACGNALASGSSCTLSITITPVTTGAVTGTITVFGTLGTGGNAQGRAELSKIHTDGASDGNSGKSSLGVIAVSASAIPPGISLSIPALSFSVTSVGTPSSGQTVTLQNTGEAASLTHLAISETNVPEFPFTTTCPATLAALTTCTITINFTPTTYGLRAGTMNITADGGIAAALPESGTAIAAVNQLAFGTPPASAVALGGTAGSSITVLERNSNGNIAVAATDTITVTVAGPIGYSRVYTAAAVAGVATFNLSSNALTIAGGYTYTAAVVSNASIKPAAASETVSQAASAVSVTAGNNPSLLQNAVTFTATVSSAAGAPTGTVNFLDGATPLGSRLLSGGVATFTTSSLAVGAHNINATYIGDTNFVAASSGTLAQAVIDFSLSAVSAGGSGSSQTVLPGSSARYSLDILPTAGTGLPAPVTLTVSGMPEGATAMVTPSSWTKLIGTSWLFPANTPLSGIALTVQLPSARANLDAKGLPGRKLPLVLWGILLVPFAGKMRRTGKRLSLLLSVLLLLIAGMTAMSGLSGCGSGTGFFAQQQKTYTVTVMATSGSLSHSTTVTLTVE